MDAKNLESESKKEIKDPYVKANDLFVRLGAILQTGGKNKEEEKKFCSMFRELEKLKGKIGEDIYGTYVSSLDQIHRNSDSKKPYINFVERPNPNGYHYSDMMV